MRSRSSIPPARSDDRGNANPEEHCHQQRHIPEPTTPGHRTRQVRTQRQFCRRQSQRLPRRWRLSRPSFIMRATATDLPRRGAGTALDHGLHVVADIRCAAAMIDFSSWIVPRSSTTAATARVSPMLEHQGSAARRRSAHRHAHRETSPSPAAIFVRDAGHIHQARNSAYVAGPGRAGCPPGTGARSSSPRRSRSSSPPRRPTSQLASRSHFSPPCAHNNDGAPLPATKHQSHVIRTDVPARRRRSSARVRGAGAAGSTNDGRRPVQPFHSISVGATWLVRLGARRAASRRFVLHQLPTLHARHDARIRLSLSQEERLHPDPTMPSSYRPTRPDPRRSSIILPCTFPPHRVDSPSRPSAALEAGRRRGSGPASTPSPRLRRGENFRSRTFRAPGLVVLPARFVSWKLGIGAGSPLPTPWEQPSRSRGSPRLLASIWGSRYCRRPLSA